MIRYRQTLAAIALSLFLAPAVLAGSGTNPKPAPYPTPIYKKPTTFPQAPQPYAVKNYHLIYGTQFKYGIYYPGSYHNHWSQVYFSPFYGCNVFVCPYTMVKYYWCPPANCYYPISYVPFGTYVF